MTRSQMLAGITSFAALILVTQACRGAEDRADPLDLEPIPLPASSITPTDFSNDEETDSQMVPAFGEVIYEHDFSSPAGGLLSGQSSETAGNEFGSRFAEYTTDGTLHVVSSSELPDYVAGANTEGMVVEGRDLSDLAEVSLEADVTPLDIGDAASWGLACRRDREVGRFYYAFVADFGAEASAGIIRQDQPGGEWAELGRAESLPQEITIDPGTTNRLRFDCSGSTLTLYLDGQEVVRATDSTYASGSIALFVNPIPSDGEASALVEFDDLVIREA